MNRLGGAAFKQFVADLWAARGWRTSVEDGTVVAERAVSGGEHRRLVVEPDSSWVGPDAADQAISTVVVRGRATPAVTRLAAEADASVVGPDELHQLLLYAVPPEAADELCRDYFGRDLRAEGPSIGGRPIRRLRPPSREVLGLALVLAVVTAGIVGASLAGGEPLWRDAEPVGSPTSVPPPTDGASGGADVTGTATPAESGIDCARSATAVLERQLPALAEHRTSADGHRGVWGRATREFGWFSTSYVAFNRTMHERPFVHFLHHSNATAQYLRGGDALARFRLIVTGTDGERYGYVVTVEPEQRASGAWCWRPTDLAYKPSLTAASTDGPTPTPSLQDSTSTGTTNGRSGVGYCDRHDCRRSDNESTLISVQPTETADWRKPIGVTAIIISL